MENVPDAFSCRLPAIEEKVRELGDESMETIQNEV